MIMKTTWTEAKRLETLAKRNLDFANAELVFEGVTFDQTDDRRDYGEVRTRTFGLLFGRLVMVVWTPRDNARHIISMRKCNDREIKAYRDRLSEA